MPIRAVLVDIGGVLEFTPDLGVMEGWEARLGMSSGEIDERMRSVWHAGELGTITLDDVHQDLSERLGLDGQQVAAFMADVWREYLGTPNTELIEYVRGLRPRYRTGISKPDPRAYALACTRLGAGLEETIFVDDVAGHVAAAGEAGLHGIQYQDNTQVIADIDKLLSR